MIFSIFDPETKIIVGQYVCSDDAVESVIGSRNDLIEGQYAIGEYKVLDGQVVIMSADEILAYKRFDVVMRNSRDQLLSAIDRVNPVWYASLTVEQQQELQSYRQHLLDVPQQAGFPTSIEWPAKPTWL